MKEDSEIVWLLFAADWPYDRLHDHDFSGLKLRSMHFMPDKTEPSSSELITRTLIAVFLVALMVSGVIALTADGVLIRLRRRAAAPNKIEARGEQVPGPDAPPPPQNQPPPAAAEGAAVPGTRTTAWKGQLGRTTNNTIVLVTVCTMIWALYFLMFCQAELKPYFEWFKLVPSLQDMVGAELKRVHTFETALILKLLGNLQLLIAILYPELYLFETRVYQVFAALLALAYSILAVFSMVYLKYWSTFLWGNSQDSLATHCLVAFWSEFCYLIFVFVQLTMLLTMGLLRYRFYIVL